MLKKIVGVLFLLAAVVFLVFAAQRVMSAPSLGYAVGSFLPSALFAVIGLFFLQKSPAGTDTSADNSATS